MTVLQAIFPGAAARSMSATLEYCQHDRLFMLRCDTPEGRFLGVLARNDWFLKSLVLPSDSRTMDCFRNEAKDFVQQVSASTAP